MPKSAIPRILLRTKRIIQFLINRDLFFKPDIKLEVHRLGSAYGGWVVPKNMLSSTSIIYSAGIGTDISFDRALIDYYGNEVYAFDPTPKSLEWLEAQDIPDSFHYFPWGLAGYDGKAEFHVPKNPSHVSHSIVKSQVTTQSVVNVDVHRIQTIMNELKHTQIDLLKMDIEGSEYSVITDLLQSPVRPTVLLVEFHHRFKSIGAGMTRACVRNLRQAGYNLYFIAPSGEELCFIYGTGDCL